MAADNVTRSLGKEIFQDVALDPSDEDDVIEADYEGFSKPSIRPYISVTPQYIKRKGLVRYKAAFKNLLPIRRQNKNNVIQVDNAGLFSLLTFSWLSKYVYKAYRKGLTINNIPSCSPLDSSELNAQRLDFLWQQELISKGPVDASFGKAVWQFTRTRVFITCFLFIISCILGFLSPAIFMRKLIQYIEDDDTSFSTGLTWALALTLCDLCRTLSLALSYSVSYRTAIRLRAACLVLVYRKLLHVNSLGNKSVGEIINLYGTDAVRLSNMIIFGPMVIAGPFVVICCGFYIYIFLGSWALLGLITFLLFYPLQYLLSRLTGYFRKHAIHKSDERIKLMTEILTTMKLIKMYAWETCFMKRVQDVRCQELSLMEKSAYCQSVGISLAPTVPVISGILIFIIHVLSGGNLTSAMAFPALSIILRYHDWKLKEMRERCRSVLNGFKSLPRFKAYPLVTLLHSQLRSSLLNLRYGSENLIDGQIAFIRIKEFLMFEEMSHHIMRPEDSSVALSINEGVFKWHTQHNIITINTKTGEKRDGESTRLTEETASSAFKLDSINLFVTKGSLIGICGSVGSGKTSLLLACLGQMRIISGKIGRSGSTAYVSQEAWIENTTLKDNIIFGESFDPKRYINALYCCALNEDVNLLPAGDETEIGERGVNLSGGQKQRVSLARAVYSNRDIYFLDDPLSAVDSQVSRHIFENCILGALGKKTVFLVTHHTKYLQKCDEILVMKDGKIVERGNHHELLSRAREYAYMVESSTLTSLENTQEDSKNTETQSNEESRTENLVDNISSEKTILVKKYMTSEEQIKGEVRSFAYHSYIKFAGGFFACILVIMSIFLNVGSIVFSSWWLAFWIKAGSGNASFVDPDTNETVISTFINDNPDMDFYIKIYGWIIGAICATSILRCILYTKITIRASEMLHKHIFEKLMRSRLRYFEITPIGRIQNLFSRDLDEVDSRLPGSMETMIQNMWVVVFAFLSITMVFPWFIIALCILAAFYYIIGKIFRVAVRDLKRIEAISRAPIFSSIYSTMSGLPIIHSFNKESDYFFQFCKKYDHNSVATYLSCCAMRWMAIRLDSISVVITLITSMLVVMLKGEVAPALAGLALTYAGHISGVLQYTLRLMTETEGRFIAVERMLLHVQKAEDESNPRKKIDIQSSWPSRGSIKFQNVTFNYSQELPPVLNGISFTVKGGEKIGIIGRTGAGKSSLVSALFRLVELDQGAIFIDGIDISCVPLSILRGRLSVISQESIVFNGTLRFNLDPFNKHTDETLWKVLQQTSLFNKVRNMQNGLLTHIGEGGVNLSVGENQLLCLARALLRGSKILVLDEATASVDPDTECTVQTTINENFTHSTILTIAHRLKTIRNCDKILVLQQGLVQEYDAPDTLLNNPTSIYSKMINSAK